MVRMRSAVQSCEVAQDLLHLPHMENKKAPQFTLLNQRGEKVSLKDELAQHNVLLYFYPKDMTPGCTIEGIGFSDRVKKFEKLNTRVFGVSADSVSRHEKFCKLSKLKIDLLSDEDKKVLEKYGVWIEKSMYGKKYMGISRESFLIGQNGKVLKHWPKVKPATHPDEVLDYLVELS